MGGRHGSTAGEGVAILPVPQPVGTQDPVGVAVAVKVHAVIATGRGEIYAGAGVGVACAPALGIYRRHRDDPVIGSGIGGQRAALVAGRGHHHHPGRAHLSQQFLAGLAEGSAAQAEVDDIRPPGGQGAGVVVQPRGEAYGLVHIVTGAAVPTQGAQRHDPRAIGHARHADAVIAGRGHGTADMGAVKTVGSRVLAGAGIFRVRVDAVTVGGVAGVADEVVAVDPLAPQVRVSRQNPGVYHGDDDRRRPGRVVPGGGQVDQRVVPLEAVALVVGCRQRPDPVVGFGVLDVRIPSQGLDRQ